MKRLTSVLLALFLVACEDPAILATVATRNAENEATASQRATMASADSPIQIPTSTPENVPTGTTGPLVGLPEGFYPINWDTRDQLLLPDPGDDRAVLESYYEPSPVVVYGFITRYMDHREAVEVGVWQAHHFLDQLKRMAPMLGGGYSPDCMSDADRCGESIPYNPFPEEGGPVQYWFPAYPDRDLPLAQQELLRLSRQYVNETAEGHFTPEQADENLRNTLVIQYDTLIALKSPNDIGRVFCIYNPWTWEQPLVARALVVDTSAVNDYTGVGGTDGIPLGYRVTLDPTDRYTHWGGEVPSDIWDQLVYGDNAWAIMVEDRGTGCPPQLNTIPWPDAQPTPTSSIIEVPQCEGYICEVPTP